jgi:hypothetical protein
LYSVGDQKLLAEIRKLSKLALPPSAAVRSMAPAAAVAATGSDRAGGRMPRSDGGGRHRCGSQPLFVEGHQTTSTLAAFLPVPLRVSTSSYEAC